MTAERLARQEKNLNRMLAEEGFRVVSGFRDVGIAYDVVQKDSAGIVTVGIVDRRVMQLVGQVFVTRAAA